MPRLSRAAIASILAVTLAACATRGAMQAGQQAEGLQEYDRAIVEYTRALREDPDNRTARHALDRMKMRASLQHFTRGRRLAETGRLEEALIELQIANDLNPGSGDIEELLASVRTQLRNKVTVAREGKTELETLVERARTLPPPGLALPDVTLPSIVWNGSARDLYSQIGKMANISIAFDPLYRDQQINIDIRNQTLDDALQAISGSTRNFFQVTAPRTVTVVPDTPAKRQEYEEEIIQTFPLSNADLKETADILRIVVDNRRLSVSTANNTIAIKDTPDRVRAAGKLIAAIDKARPEVVIDVEILEVDRTKLREYGLQIASPGDPNGINGSVTVDDMTLRDLRRLTDADVFLTNLPGLFYRLLKQDTNTRTLANTQLRISEGQAAQAQFGERVPVPTTQFAPIATGGVAQQPITSFAYETVGVNLELTPRTHHDDSVTLAVKVQVSSLSGFAGFGGLPTFGNRLVSTVNRLRDGETNLLAGLIRDDERVVRRGIPGLSDIPAVGHLFAHNRRETQESDIVVTLTPRIIRVLDVSEEDLRAFRVGRDGATAAFELNIPVPGAVPPPDPAQQPPPVQPQPQAPILQPDPIVKPPPAPPGK